MRLRPDGARDTATWDNGLAVLELGYQSSALAIVALDDDLAISGYRDSQIIERVTVHDSYVARIDGASGALDEDFGHHGVTAIDYSRGPSGPSTLKRQRYSGKRTANSLS